MVQPYSESMVPDFRPAKRTFKDTVKLAVNRTLKPRREREVDTNTLASSSLIESRCSTLINFSVGSEEPSWHSNGSTRPTSEAHHRVWPAVVPDPRAPTRDDFLRLTPDADTASIDTQMLDLEDNAWGPPRRSAFKSKSQKHTSKRGIFSRSSPKS